MNLPDTESCYFGRYNGAFCRTPVYREAENLVDAGRLGEITPLNGGAECVIQSGPGGGPAYGVWVGVVVGAFTADCDCRPPDADPDELCAHAVALTLGALRSEFVWSSSATPPGQDELSVHLRGAWQRFDPEPEEIDEALRDVHVRLCEELLPDPDELIERILDVVGQAEISSCLDAPEDHLAVLGPDGVAALDRR